MILDMNIKLEGIDQVFLDELEDLIEDTRVEYFIINPEDEKSLQKAKALCLAQERFRYTLPLAFKEEMDGNCIAYRIQTMEDLSLADQFPLVVSSGDLSEELIKKLNDTGRKGVVLHAKESDARLENFAYAISHNSLKHWTQQGITDTDINKIALQSDYPENSYDDLMDGLLKNISDLTFRAEQTIAAGGTRTVLKMFGLI